MRCSEFRDLHCSYIDDTLAGVELVRMQTHIAECPECSAADTRVRRSLMVLHSIPSIEPSADFAARLDARIKECKVQDQLSSGMSFRTFAMVGAAASLVMLAYVGESLRATDIRPHDIVLPPVVAFATPPDTTPVPEIVASVSAGMPMWAAASLVEQAPIQLVSYTQAR